MQDARLAELKFLSHLETAVHYSSNVANFSPGDGFGLNRDQYRDMLLNLLVEECVNYPPTIPVQQLPHIPDFDRELRRRHAQALTNFMTNADMSFRINHKGRLRLWRLREELLSNRQLEDHGILLRQHYRDRDFEIAWLFLENGKPVSVLYSDLDNFKAVNTKLGHGPGDEVMKLYLSVIRDEVRGVGEAYRGVGDEVTVIFPGLGKEPSERIAQAIRTKVEEQCKTLPVLKDHEPVPTVSIGGATFRSKVTPDTAFAFVDRLLMEEGKRQKNVVIFKEYLVS